MEWKSIGSSFYTVRESEPFQLKMYVLSCEFKNCKSGKPVERSSHSKYPSTDGWARAKNIHYNGSGIDIYMKKNNNDTLTLVAYYNGVLYTSGQGKKAGKYYFTF